MTMILKHLAAWCISLAMVFSIKATDVQWASGHVDLSDGGATVHINPNGNLILTIQGTGALTFKARGSSDGFYFYVDGDPWGYIRRDSFNTYTITFDSEGTHTVGWYCYDYNQIWGEVSSIMWNGVELRYRSLLPCWSTGGVSVINDGETLHVNPSGYCEMTVEGSGVLTFMARGSSDGFYCYVDGKLYDYIRNSAFEQINIAVGGEGAHTIGWYVYAGTVCWGELMSVSWNGKPFEFLTEKQELIPQFAYPDGTIFETSLKVSIVNAHEDSIFYYTLDGSEPTTNSAVFKKFTITEKTTIKAIASWNGKVSSVAVARYGKGKVATPVISASQTGGFIHAGNSIRISCETENVEIHYTLNGEEPTAESPTYNGEFLIDETTTVRAIAVGHSDYIDSDIASAEFSREWVKVATPKLYSKSGATIFYFSGEEITIVCADADAKIFYTTDGSEPTEDNGIMYDAPFAIDNTTTIKAVAVKDDYTNSDVASCKYIRKWVSVSTPSISNLSDSLTFNHAGEVITLRCDLKDARLYYTLDGSVPSETNGAFYETPFKIDDTTTVKVIAVKDDYADSEVIEKTFTRVWQKVSTPQIKSYYNDLETATLEGSYLSVEICCGTDGASIHYTIDGTTPSIDSPLYESPFKVMDSRAIKAMAIKNDWKDSNVASLDITKVWTAGDSLNVPDMRFSFGGEKEWMTDTKVAHDNVASMRSGEIGDGETSLMQTSVEGEGVLRFWWKVSCEATDLQPYWWDYGSFYIDGKEVACLDGVRDWLSCEYVIEGAGPHELKWKYAKDKSGADGADCVWVDELVWIPKGKVAQPTFDQSDFEFVGSVRYVTVECITEGAAIYYTLDGSTPTKESIPYDGRIKITDTATIKVRAFKEGFDDSEVATMTMTKKWAVGDTLNAPEQVFEMPPAKLTSDLSWKKDIKVSHDGVASLRSGDISSRKSTTLRTSVQGKGTVVFWWKASCEGDYDYGSFSVDGKVQKTIYGELASGWETPWELVRLEIDGDVTHELAWTYSKDEEDSEGADCIWVDEFVWIPADGSAVTKKNDVPVPYAWLDAHGLLSEHDPETVACQKSGKVDGAGRELTMADEFVAGTNPNDPTSNFKVKIEIVNGKPILSWEPDLNENGTKDLRVYKTYGVKNLGDADEWTDMDEVSESEKELFNFFKVKVEMPKVEDGNGGGEGGSSSGEGESSQDEGLPKGFSTNGIERVSCTGSEWYDLGLPPTLTMKTEIKWSIAGGDAKTIGIIGVMNSGGSYYMGVAPNGETYQGRVFILDEEIKIGAAYRDTAYEVEFGNCYLKDMVSGSVLKSKTARTGACPTSNIRLFRINYTSLNQFALGSVYYLRIYDVNGLGEYELLRNLVPCKSKFFGIGLLDLVQMRFYKKDGTSVSLMD